MAYSTLLVNLSHFIGNFGRRCMNMRSQRSKECGRSPFAIALILVVTTHSGDDVQPGPTTPLYSLVRHFRPPPRPCPLCASLLASSTIDRLRLR